MDGSNVGLVEAPFQPISMQRDNSIDLVRGCAVVTMVWANLAPFALIDPHPLWFRFIGSFAAPIFVFLAGATIPMTAFDHRHDFSYYCQRASLVVLLAMAIDMAVWREWPWFSFDVLYLIGVGMPIIYLTLRITPTARALIAAGILLGSAFLRDYLGYPETLRHPPLGAIEESVRSALIELDDNILTGGFFPLFPWLAIMMFGSILGTWRSRALGPHRLIGPKPVTIALGLLVIGMAGWYFDPGQMQVRSGYSEIFYPATTGYLMLALAVVICALIACDYLRDNRLLEPIRKLGRSSLFVYWWHIALIHIGVHAWMEPQHLSRFIAVYAVVMIVLYVSVLGLQSQSQRLAKLPLAIRFPLSG
jgi:uncharacterized membrane protein